MAVEWYGPEMLQMIRKATMRGIIRGSESVLEEGTRLLNSPPKTGRKYRRRGVTHQASAPGEAPASDTGRLAQSGRTFYDHAGLVGRINWSTVYARPLELGSSYAITASAASEAMQLEFGTQSRSPRPFARPALMNKIAIIQADIAAEVGAVLKGKGPVQGELF